MDAKADATSQNDKIFENYKLKFSSAEMYLEIAGKFAAWLKDVRAYYAKAQPKIIDICETAYRTACAAVGCYNITGLVPLGMHKGHPIIAAYIKVINTVLVHKPKFGESPGLLDRLLFLEKTTHGSYPSASHPEPPTNVTASTSAIQPRSVPQSLSSPSSHMTPSSTGTTLVHHSPSIAAPSQAHSVTPPTQDPSSSAAPKPFKPKKRKTKADLSRILDIDRAAAAKRATASAGSVLLPPSNVIDLTRGGSPISSPTNVQSIKNEPTETHIPPSKIQSTDSSLANPQPAMRSQELEAPNTLIHDPSIVQDSGVLSASLRRKQTDVAHTVKQGAGIAGVDVGSNPIKQMAAQSDLRRPSRSPSIMQVDGTGTHQHSTSDQIPSMSIPATVVDTGAQILKELLGGLSHKELEPQQTNLTTSTSRPPSTTQPTVNQIVPKYAEPAAVTRQMLRESLPLPIVSPNASAYLSIEGHWSGSPGLFAIDVPHEHYAGVLKWKDRKDTEWSELCSSICVSMGCYPRDSLPAGTDLSSFFSKPVLWPQHGRVNLLASYQDQEVKLPLSPPYTTIPGGLFDLTEFLSEGKNEFALHCEGDVDPCILIVFNHSPTIKQLEDIQEQRCKKQEWNDWLFRMSRPLVQPPKTLIESGC